MNTAEKTNQLQGIRYSLPKELDKNLTVVDVGMYHEDGRREEINKFLNVKIESLSRINTYILIHSANKEKFVNIEKKKPFLDPAIFSASSDISLASILNIDFDFALNSMLNPGTSDAQGNIALEQAMVSAGAELEKGDSGFLATTYFLKGDLSGDQLDKVSGFLSNPELYKRQIISKNEFDNGFEIKAPVVLLKNEIHVEKIPVTTMSDDDLLNLNAKRKLAGTLPEMQHFKAAYTDPVYLEERKKYGLDEQATDVEIESWFGLRSEHCFHKEFNAEVILDINEPDDVIKRAQSKGWLNADGSKYSVAQGMFKTFIQEPAENIYDALEKRGKNWIASMFSDNSGVVYYDSEYMYCLKVETHNSPSNIEPVQGAKTGLNGNFRDIMGTMQGTFDILMGFFYYCTGSPNYKGWLPKGVKHPYTLLKGITRGVREAGNEMQIPTLAGNVVCDPRYIAKCLVYCGAVGWSAIKSKVGADYRTKEPQVGDHVFVAGQAVGIDGIHGATESSLSASQDISLGHVQADFSFIQAKVKEFILEASRQSLFTAVTDFGAMGLGSASHETARATGGLDMDLKKHPVKYQGIQPWQINCSETQDRMLLVVDPSKIQEVEKLAKFYNVEIADIGKLNDSGYVKLNYGDEVVGLIDIDKLFDKEPTKVMCGSWKASKEDANQTEINLSLQDKVNAVLESPDISSKEWFFRQKDSSVKGGTIQGPLYGKDLNVETDAAIQKPIDTRGRDEGAIAYAIAACPKLTDYDSYLATQKSYLDVIGKVLAVGAKLPDMNTPEWNAWAMCGNYCQPNSDSKYTLIEESGERNLAELIREGIAVRELIEEFNIPIISGKDSMKCSCVYEVSQEFSLSDVPADLAEHIRILETDGKKKIEIHDPPTYLVSVAAKIEDYKKCQNAEFKQAGDLIYIVGDTKKGLGASSYYSAIGYKLNGKPIPGEVEKQYSASEFIEVANCLYNSYQKDLIASCSYVHNGGALVSLFKSCLASACGAKLDISSISIKPDEFLFSESPGRFIITVNPKDKDVFEEAFSDVKCLCVGEVVEGADVKIVSSDSAEEINILDAKNYYKQTFDFGGMNV